MAEGLLRFRIQVIVFVLIALINHPIEAREGVGHGGGGDSYAAELVRLGQVVVSRLEARPVPEVEAKAVREMLAIAKVESEEELFLNGKEVDAINYPDATPPLILLSRKRWDRLSSTPLEKLKLTFHEYLGLLRIDDANYRVSTKIIWPEDDWLCHRPTEDLGRVTTRSGQIVADRNQSNPIQPKNYREPTEFQPVAEVENYKLSVNGSELAVVPNVCGWLTLKIEFDAPIVSAEFGTSPLICAKRNVYTFVKVRLSDGQIHVVQLDRAPFDERESRFTRVRHHFIVFNNGKFDNALQTQSPYGYTGERAWCPAPPQPNPS